MGATTKISWADHTFNPWMGCAKVSEACSHCYAETVCKTKKLAQWGSNAERVRTSPNNWKQPLIWNRAAQKTGRIGKVFCCSLADVFDEKAENTWRDDLWQLIKDTPSLIWLLLTKRPQNIKDMLPPEWGEKGWPNVCLMTTVENQHWTIRIPTLLEVPAHYYGLSVEPLLGPIQFDQNDLQRLDWVIVGGESGSKARAMHPQWVRDIRDQCEADHVSFFFKQWGCWAPAMGFEEANWKSAGHFSTNKEGDFIDLRPMKRAERDQYVSTHSKEGAFLFRKASAEQNGHELDGRVYHAHPFSEAVAPATIQPNLSEAERERLCDCEEKIAKGLRNFFEVGRALAEIRKSKLYRETHATFEDYVRAVWDLTRRRAYSLMDSTEVMDLLCANEHSEHLPANEGQVRELHRFRKNPQLLRENWTKVIEAAGGKPVTARVIREVLPKPSRHREVKLNIKNVLKVVKNKPIDLQRVVCLSLVRKTLKDDPLEEVAFPLIDKLINILRGRQTDTAAVQSAAAPEINNSDPDQLQPVDATETPAGGIACDEMATTAA